MTTDQDILSTISSLVAEEKSLRERRERGDADPETELARLNEVETSLDQCWDLLRQRRAKAEFGEDPGEAQVRPASEVEGYLS
ncbi:DUF2630 family protein [Mumia zhuanghuii]|jgi:hypothetical protein|uniref:DUF2630 family protein n=1 Tax=Mumia zhuanghuii TaxID=2585211 RepID=A0A5C4MZA3_9ACTN|nr:DUF2630 family protein [Mumia zhuanghuii]TNC49499.1 DUF2630 family protein [Mumia zhuanghuii]TNC49659.1 DUF2630 family protein [Mumia zhuanghuii]